MIIEVMRKTLKIFTCSIYRKQNFHPTIVIQQKHSISVAYAERHFCPPHRSVLGKKTYVPPRGM